MSNTALSRADPVVVFPLCRWCPPQQTSQPHPPPKSHNKTKENKTVHISWDLVYAWQKGDSPTVALISQTPDIFSLVDAAWKHPKYPWFCTLPLEFVVNIDIHKHENSEVLCSNRNKSPKEMSGNSRLQMYGKHVNRFHLTKCTG